MRIASKSTVPAQADGISAGILLRNVKKKDTYHQKEHQQITDELRSL